MKEPFDDEALADDGNAPRVIPEHSGPVTAEIISVGRELLNGRVADSNAGTLARLLTRRGAVLHRVTIVGDEEAAIASAIRETLARNRHLVVVSGGLGPAAEDRTMLAVSSTSSGASGGQASVSDTPKLESSRNQVSRFRSVVRYLRTDAKAQGFD